MLRIPLSLASLLLTALSPVQALNWTSTRDAPAFTDPGGDKIQGVNLGGWFILENWMQSDLFAVSPLDQYDVLDEWTYCNILGKTECASRLAAHMDSWITEDDFREIAQRGMNTVRIPFPYWALIELEEWEPYVNASQLDYLEKGLRWAKTYDLDVMIDLHTLPGSQNGYDNSGLLGQPAWCSNTTNVDRSVDSISRLTRAVTKEEFEGVVKAIEVINEPILDTSTAKTGGCPFDTLADYYVRAYDAVRAEEHVLDGASPVMVVIHDAFQPVLNWEYFFTTEGMGAAWENFGLDTHIYQAWNPDFTQEQHLSQPCTQTSALSQSQSNWTTFVGEFSLGTQTYCVAYKDCVGVRMEDNMDLSLDTAVFTNHFWEAQKAVYEQAGGWIFWSWKTDAAPTWSMQQSTRQGWIPDDLTNGLYSFDASATDSCTTLTDSSSDLSFPTYYVSNSSLLVNETISTPSTDTKSNNTATTNTTSGSDNPTSGVTRGIGESSYESSARLSLALGSILSLLAPATLMLL